MRAAIFRGPEDVVFGEAPDPTLEDGDVLIRVRACGICGSDLHTYRHGLFLGLGAPTPGGRILGHEFSGDVVEIRGEAAGVKVGDRIATAGIGGNAEYFRMPAEMVPILVPMPDNISYEEAATTEPLATSVHAVNLAAPGNDQTLVIMGAGIIGLGILQVIRAVSSAKVIVVDLSDRRLAMAEQLGADIVINAGRENAVDRILEITGSTPLDLLESQAGNVDTVFDCVGVPRNFQGTSVLEQALSLVKPDGKVIVVAVFERNVELDFNVIVRAGIQLHGSWAWTPEEFMQAAELIRSGKIDRKPLITHRFGLEEANTAYQTQLRAGEAIKVMITP